MSHKSALIAWGAFYFRTRSRREWKLVDESDLRYVHRHANLEDVFLKLTGREMRD
ncbi:hypothetical protein D3C83_251510 [compost metagenome]